MDIENQQVQLDKQNLVDIEVLVGMTKMRNVEIKKLTTQLQKNGFCFVLLPKETQILAQNVENSFSQYLHSINSYGDKYFSAPSFGIQEQKYKTSFTTLTGKFTNNPQQSGLSKLVPDQKNLDPLQKISQNLDSIADTIIEFVPEFSQVIKRNQYQETLLRDQSKKFGALDMVYYHPCNNQYEVKPHVDPGLFSINVLNNSYGLQFLNSDKQWVESISSNRQIGVIWNGVYANKVTQGKMAQGWHRVLPTNTGRFTMWYEVVIRSQVPEQIQNNGLLALKHQNNLYDINKLNQMVQNPQKQSDVITIHIQTQDNRKLTLQVNSRQETMGSLKSRAEDKLGLRFMKQIMTIQKAQCASNPGLQMKDDVPFINYGVKDGDLFYMVVGSPYNNNNQDNDINIFQLFNNNNYNGITSKPQQKQVQPQQQKQQKFQQKQFQMPLPLPQPQQQQQYQNQSQKRQIPSNLPTPPYGRYKYADQNQIKVMEQHSKVCKYGCILWNGPWGRFLGGKAGSEYFDLTTNCMEGQKLNLDINWNYLNPAY